MALPPNIATPTLVTGKTNQSQVVDVYSDNAAIQDNVAQNAISSVLAGSIDSLFGNTKSGILKVLDSDKFVSDMQGLVNKTLNGDINSKTIKDTLREYKKGALSSILEANGIKDVKVLKNNIIENVSNNVKNLAFGSVKGVVDNIVPGVLDEAGIQSFDDCKRIYDNTASIVRSVQGKGTDTITATLGDDVALQMDISATVLDNCVDIINNILQPEKKITEVNDREINNAVLVSAATPLIESDNTVMNDYLLDGFGEDTRALKDFITTMLPKAVAKGAYRFIAKAALKTSKEEVSWAIGEGSSDFLSKVVVSPPPTNSDERLQAQEAIISALEMVSWADRTLFNVSDFKGITDSAYEVLRFGPYATLASLARNVQPLTANQMMANNFDDFIIT